VGHRAAWDTKWVGDTERRGTPHEAGVRCERPDASLSLVYISIAWACHFRFVSADHIDMLTRVGGPTYSASPSGRNPYYPSFTVLPEALESDRCEVEEDHNDDALAEFWLGRLEAWWVCVSAYGYWAFYASSVWPGHTNMGQISSGAQLWAFPFCAGFVLSSSVLFYSLFFPRLKVNSQRFCGSATAAAAILSSRCHGQVRAAESRDRLDGARVGFFRRRWATSSVA